MDSKEIRMPYSEYKELQDLLTKLQEEREILLKKDQDLPIIDFRYDYSPYPYRFISIPKIYVGREEALEKLSKEFDQLHDEMKLIELQNHDLHLKIKKLETVKKKWWQ